VKGILQGLRVVEGSVFVAAPLGGMTLAQLGADAGLFSTNFPARGWLAVLGLSSAQAGALHDAGVVAGPSA
jgi:hypothetical protein